jgi:ABC-type multidrug transport system ATPase subunit
MTVQAAIEAHAVSHRTRANEVAVRDITMTVGHGELVAIIGGTASGKATLLDVLSGLRAPTSGTVTRPSADQLGYVPSGDSLHPVLPLATALRYTAELRSVRACDGAVEEALGRVGLSAASATPVGELNPGERKRAVIAAELLARPTQLFLDEPTTGLDPAQAAEVLRLLRRLCDVGLTVLLTTRSALDAASGDKVAVLADGGHLAFFGTPAAARAYFGADSLEEIYERLAGLGDPAAAWSRRFFQFSRARAGLTTLLAPPLAPGPAVLVPDLAGPHSAGRASVVREYGTVHEDEPPDDDAFIANLAGLPGSASVGHSPAAAPIRCWTVLVRRNAEVMARARRALAVLVGTPVAVLLVLCLLLGVGALNGATAVTLAWAVLGALVTGLAYELPTQRAESRVLRRERFSGQGTFAFLAAKAAVLLPVLAIADLVILAVPAADGHLRAGFGLTYLAVLGASLVGLCCALAIPVLEARR